MTLRPHFRGNQMRVFPFLRGLFTISYQLRTMSYCLSAMSLLALALASCTGGPNMDQQKTALLSIKNVPAEAWQKLSQKKIYFGHQSVGYNIIDGIKDVTKENPQVKLNIVETSNPSDFTNPLFAHSPVGKNMDPKSKTDAFAGFMDAGLGNKADIAFFKFCYVDISPNTDVNKVFTDYNSAISALRTKYPQTTFIHVTNPLTAIQAGPKAFIKKIIGKPLGGYEDNMKREQFNTMLRKEYTGREPVFDLAAIESTNPDGSRVSFGQNGVTAYALVPAYTNDGGHLNEQGRKLVAEQLLILLANIASK
jgi:hypothetical protein